MEQSSEVESSKASKGSQALHAAFSPFASGTAGSLLIGALAELAGLLLILVGIQLGLEQIFPEQLCTSGASATRLFHCFSHYSSLAWVAVSLLTLWLWSFVSCSLRSNKLVHISLLNALVMLSLLIYFFFSKIDWLSLALLECLVFFTMFSSYKQSFRKNSRK